MKIAIYGHYFNQEAQQYVEDLLNALNKKNATIYIEERFLRLMKSSFKVDGNYKTFDNYNDLNNSFDFMFTIGGDGTILRSITYLRDSNIPVIGVNVGRLGFLATVNKEHISEAIDNLQNKNYTIKERTLLSINTEPKIDALEDFNFALNEITLSRKNTASMITVETYLDDEYLTSYWADGLIASTPTGSTGYSLSCGGPVISPQAKSFVLTPVAPHNLNARPLIIPDNTEIKMRVSGRENEFFLSLDSRIVTINNQTTIHIKKASFTIKMIELENHSFIKTLRKKLLWGEDTRNK
ncbi:MAG: NAD kinase [Flavobacteriaceae bacterium]|nr:NAD kinase [Flavobacteriaceae bacterium]